ncbi:MAG TPA: hypothetical protein VHV83_19710 [Armatimonadota bacterium]|nr:hypothetical protein [Armatimonadota bacterium]
MKFQRWCLTLFCAGAMAAACYAQDALPATDDVSAPAPAPAPLPKPALSDVVQMVSKDAKIDWTIFQFRATGIGVAPETASGSRAKALAREAAITVAERNLLKITDGVHITSETQVENLIMTSDVIKTKLEGVLQGAVIVNEKDMDDGSYMVVMAIPMLGKSSLADAVDLPAQVDKATPQDDLTMADVTAPKAVKGNVTGLLIDCRGLKVSPAMSPAILAVDDQTIYPREDITPDTLVKKGVVAYFKSVDAAKASGRVGARPLIIKASSIKKDGDDMWYTSPIVSQADAARILAEDSRSDFMSRLGVGFIVD